ncbi:MAG: hypothetical protein KZQ97_19370, partial [Candidatus Thiodiazotropha sp. (ex Dulcina madagascariensis)]|nr:hypothetical protein [Candidatus Thiodiazotropha sp. (ex Dulcina madagascariensis)]
SSNTVRPWAGNGCVSPGHPCSYIVTRLADQHSWLAVQTVSSWLMVLPSAGIAMFPVQKILANPSSQN